MGPSAILAAQLLVLFAAVALVQRLLVDHRLWLRNSAREEQLIHGALSAEQVRGIEALGTRALAAMNSTAGEADLADVPPRLTPNGTAGDADPAEVPPRLGPNGSAGEADPTEVPPSRTPTAARSVQCAPGCGSRLGAKCPLVVALHGMRDNDASMMKLALFGWNSALLFADARYCIVFPRSTSGQDWNLKQGRSRDFQLVANVANQAITAYNIDPSAVYLLGYSHGGVFGYEIMCGFMSHPFVAFASVEAQPVYTKVGRSKRYCCPNPKFHLMAVQGTADRVFPINQVRGYPFCATQPQVAYKHGRDNSCSTPSKRNAVFLPNTVITAYEDGCNAGGSASLYKIIGGTHSAVSNALWKEVWHYFTAVVLAKGQ